MRKKLFGVFIAVCLTAPLFAAFQYDSISSVSSEIGGNKTAMVVLGGGGGMLQNSMVVNRNLFTYVTLAQGSAKDIASFGIYTISGNSIGERYEFVKIAGTENQYTAVDSKGNAVEFSAGQQLGMWITSGENTVYSTPGLDEGHKGTYTDRDVVNDTYLSGFFGQFSEGLWPSDRYEPGFILGVNVSSTRPTPLGQPLPGVIAAVLIGAGAIAARRKLRTR